MYRIASLFFSQRLKGSMLGDALDFSNIETRAAIKKFFPLQRKFPKEIRNFDRKVWGICTIVCHRQKVGGTV